MNQAQIPLRIEVNPDLIEIEPSFGGAISLCAKVAKIQLDKEVTSDLGFDKAQFSPWQTGGEGITWEKLCRLMDYCGNDAPLLWMVHQRGFDLGSMRRKKTELELRVEHLEAENARLRLEREIEMRTVRQIRVAA